MATAGIDQRRHRSPTVPAATTTSLSRSRWCRSRPAHHLDRHRQRHDRHPHGRGDRWHELRSSETGSAKVEISNNATYGCGTIVEIDATALVGDTSVTVTLRRESDSAALAALFTLPLSPAYLWVTDSAGARNAPASSSRCALQGRLRSRRSTRRLRSTSTRPIWCGCGSRTLAASLVLRHSNGNAA